MPAKERIALGVIYDKFANNEVHRLDEREAWLELAQFDGATALGNEDLMRLRALITRARYRHRHLNDNALGYFEIGKAWGITPHIQDDAPAMDPAFCRPMIPAQKSPA